MSQPGLGAMLHYLSGGSPKSASDYYGQKIVSASLDDDALKLGLDSGKTIKIWDNGQSCCESRYMRTDDQVASLVGHTLTRIEAKEAPNEPDEYGEHEVVFVEVGTDQNFVTIASHNEHNGYYGGFGLSIDEV